MKPLLALTICLVASLISLPAKDADPFDVACGQLIRASLRFPPNQLRPALASPHGDTIEAVFSTLEKSGHWNAFTIAQKTEFTLIALALCQIEGGETTQLAIMLASDGPEVGKRLRSITDQTLSERFHFDSSALKRFRHQAAFITGLPAASPR